MSVPSLNAHYGIDQEELKKRLDLFGFTREDRENIQFLHDLIDTHLDDIMDAFYFRLGEIPELEPFLADDIVVNRLKKMQRMYLLSLGVDIDTAGYFEDRLHIGATHERVGLHHKWYLGANMYFIALIVDQIVATSQVEAARLPGLFKTLVRVISLDQSLVVETYYRATTDRLEAILVELSQAQEELERAAQIDDLSGIDNRGYLMKRLDEELERSLRLRHPFTVLLLDIDHFKKFNDTYGHAFGDLAIRKTAGAMRAAARSIDIAGRYGGEEFVIGLVECGASDAEIIANRLRENIAKIQIQLDGASSTLTVSIGVASASAGESDASELIARADKALYEAKNTGRNRVCVSA